MKTEDFDRLKAVCEKEGFELLNEIDTGNEKSLVLIGVKVKDIWEGVEFGKDKDGKIVSFIANPKLLLCKDCEGNYIARKIYTPSTESAYIEQLKAECFKRFGEIKEGDRFHRSWYDAQIQTYIGKYPGLIGKGFDYTKSNDCLTFDGIIIYQQGKWATRVKERVKVENIDRNWSGNPDIGFKFKFKFRVDNGGANVCMIKAGDFLASKLEEYLNKE